MIRNFIKYRYDDATLRRYEPYIKQCFRSLPEAIEIDPGNFSVQTFYARFNDALRYYLETDIEIDGLQKDFVRDAKNRGAALRLLDNKLIFSNKAVTKIEKPLEAEIKRNVFPGHDAEVVKAWAVILSRSLLTPGTGVTFTEIPEETHTEIAINYPNLLLIKEGGFTQMI